MAAAKACTSRGAISNCFATAFHHVAHPADVATDDRQARQGRFDHRVRQPLGFRGKDEHIGAAQQLGHVVTHAHELYNIAHAGMKCLGLERRAAPGHRRRSPRACGSSSRSNRAASIRSQTRLVSTSRPTKIASRSSGRTPISARTAGRSKGLRNRPTSWPLGTSWMFSSGMPQAARKAREASEFAA